MASVMIRTTVVSVFDFK